MLDSVSSNDDIFGELDGVLGDVFATVEICEDELWKMVAVCQNGREQWTMGNTAVACRQLGYPIASTVLGLNGRRVTQPDYYIMAVFVGESGMVNYQVVESSKRLSYIPQCIRSEERLRECPTLNQHDNCDAPLIISCWSNSTTIFRPSATTLSHSIILSSPNKPSFSSSSSSSFHFPCHHHYHHLVFPKSKETLWQIVREKVCTGSGWYMVY